MPWTRSHGPQILVGSNTYLLISDVLHARPGARRALFQPGSAAAARPVPDQHRAHGHRRRGHRLAGCGAGARAEGPTRNHDRIKPLSTRMWQLGCGNGARSPPATRKPCDPSSASSASPARSLLVFHRNARGGVAVRGRPARLMPAGQGLSRFAWSGQRMPPMIACADLAWGGDHGWQVTRHRGRGAEARLLTSGVRGTGPRRIGRGRSC